MIIKFLNAVLIVAVLVSASVLYSLEQNKRAVAREIARTENSIAEEKETIKQLVAEWSSLTRPDRVRELASQYTQLQPSKTLQFATIRDLPQLLPAHPFVNLEPQGKDAIGEALQEMPQ